MATIGRSVFVVGAVGGGTGGPRMRYIFTVPVTAASVLGGRFYSINSIAPWICILGTTSI
jgi:hypothetical protein